MVVVLPSRMVVVPAARMVVVMLPGMAS